MKYRALACHRFALLPIACALLPTLALLSGCGGATAGDGAGVPSAGSASAGAGMSSAGSSPSAGSSSAGATSGGNPGAGAGASNGGSESVGASCVVGDVTYASGAHGFLGPDGCNQCSCLDGQLSCTLLACEAPPPTHCEGFDGVACGKGSYCKHPQGECGTTDAGGECTRYPGDCLAQDYAPVCACDGNAYRNACSAAFAGKSLAHQGLCEAAPGSCSVTVDGASYADGTTGIPAGDGCNVCACNNGTLTCSAHPCKAPTRCGARAGDTCDATEYCAYTSGQACGAADAEAVCKPRPSVCSTFDKPVCACDGMTYPNTCSAALAGSGVALNGACPGR